MSQEPQDRSIATWATTGRSTARQLAYIAIDSERLYQDRTWVENSGATEQPVRTVAEELLMLEDYVARARKAWTDAPRATEVQVTTDILRKCAGIAVRALENHGAPVRGEDGTIVLTDAQSRTWVVPGIAT